MADLKGHLGNPLVRYGTACVAVLLVGWFGLRGVDESKETEDNKSGLVDSGSRKAGKPETAPARESGMRASRPAGDNERSGTITPEEARSLLEKARSIPGMMERSVACGKIIQRLCEAGYVEEAWGMIEGNAGQLRNVELSAFFMNSGLEFNQIAERMEDLPYRREASLALSGYIRTLDSQGIRNLVKDPAFKDLIKKLAVDEPGVLGNVLGSYLSTSVAFSKDPTKMEEALNMAVEFRSQGLIDDDALATTIDQDTTSDAFEKWTLVADNMKSAVDNSEAGELRKKTIEEMIESDAPKAISRLIQVPGDQGSADLFLGLKQWGKIDPSAANQWFNENRNTLSETQRDGAAGAFFQLALDYREPESAAQWANEIIDPELKKRALMQLPQNAK